MIDWDSKHAKSFGNGIIRISVMDLVKIIVFCCLAYAGWRDIKTAVNTNNKGIAATDARVAIVQHSVDSLQTKIESTSDRVLVLETIRANTNHIRRDIRELKEEDKQEIIDALKAKYKRRHD